MEVANVEKIIGKKLLLTKKEIAELLSIAPNTVQNQLNKGIFPIKRFKPGRPLRFRIKDVLDYINKEE